MNGAADPPRRLSHTNRVEAFSDGVLAVAITILVLDLRSPAHQPGELRTGLVRLWPGYLGYLASFLYVGVIWINHHAAFRRIRYLDRALSWANLGILLTTVLLPFPTAVLADALREQNPTDARTAAGLYALVAALMCLSWLVFYHYLRNSPHLVHSDTEERFFHHERKRAVAGIVLYTCGGVLGYLVTPIISLAVFLALPVFYGATSEGLTSSRALNSDRGRAPGT
ncbi:MAG: TMEM175 family protein [Pseudonocardiaceae bacterium]